MGFGGGQVQQGSEGEVAAAEAEELADARDQEEEGIGSYTLCTIMLPVFKACLKL